MTTNLLLVDDDRARLFDPFIRTRPVSELVSGITSVRRRWEVLVSAQTGAFQSALHLREFDEEGAPIFSEAEVPANTILVNSRFVPALPLSTDADADVWIGGGHVVAIRNRNSLKASALAADSWRLERIEPAGQRTCELEGVWLDEVWDLVRLLPAQLASDIQRVHDAMSQHGMGAHFRPADVVPRIRLSEAASVLGDFCVIVASDAQLDPHVVLDARNGPILIASGATVQSFSRIEGPCFIGAGSTVLSGRIGGSSIGPRCKVNGEVSSSVMVGYSNKAHDGFLGHSYLGCWVNLGAGTITSNLKNTYGPISVATPEGVRNTGLQFLGTLFGDHARTGIGTMLATGTVLGAGSNVFGGVMPPKYVPPFSWGEGENLTEYSLPKFLEVAERVMQRRGIVLSEGMRRMYTEVHRTAQRR